MTLISRKHLSLLLLTIFSVAHASTPSPQKEVRRSALATSIVPGLKFHLKTEVLQFDEAKDYADFYPTLSNGDQVSCEAIRKNSGKAMDLKKAIYTNAHRLELRVNKIIFDRSVANTYSPFAVFVEVGGSEIISHIRCRGFSTVGDFLDMFHVDVENQMSLLPVREVIVEDLSGPSVNEAEKAYSSHI